MTGDKDNAENDFEQTRLALDKMRVELDKARVHYDNERLKLEHYKIRVEVQRGVFDAGIKFAEMGLRALLVINGGAAVALLTFAGNAGRLGVAVQSGKTAAPLIAFGVGAALSIMTAFLAYVAQVTYFEITPHERGHKIGDRVRVLCIFCGIVSWLLFCTGLWLASQIM